MPELTIKDLPDVAKIDDKKSYTLKGIHLRAIVSILGHHQRGENIGHGTVTPFQNGDNGYTLRGLPPGAPGDVFNIGGSPTYFPLQPYSDASTHSNPRVTVIYGTYAGFIPTISGTPLVVNANSNILTLGGGDTIVYMQCDFTYSSDGVFIDDAEIMSTSGSVPDSTISSTGGAGSGTLYQELFGVMITAPVGAGNYTIIFAPAVGGSQNFGVCLDPTGGTVDLITGPWGV